MVDEFKVGRGCSDCGERDLRCLDLHHRDQGTKRKAVSTLVVEHAPTARVIAECEKCDVLCANCHRRRHNGNRNKKERAGKKAGAHPGLWLFDEFEKLGS
ncbi:MAG: hypothetical protein KGL39_35510 [Patescibacteria group bacterium]|nr:hypothetical protein [Patescibacteria group bacterium]